MAKKEVNNPIDVEMAKLIPCKTCKKEVSSNANSKELIRNFTQQKVRKSHLFPN